MIDGRRGHSFQDETGRSLQSFPGTESGGIWSSEGWEGRVEATSQIIDGYVPVRYSSRVNYIFRRIRHFSGYALGDSPTTFAPGRSITRAEAATMLYRLSGAPDIPGTSHFPDVSDGAWYRAPVMYLHSRGVILGLPDGTFRPNQIITRAEFAAILVRYAELDTSIPAATQFPDVAPTQWYYTSVGTLVDSGWVVGFTDGTFRPANHISRAEAVTMINRMDGRTAVNIPADVQNPFTDVPSNHWALGAILSASRWHDCEWHTPEPFARGVERWRDAINPGAYPSFPALLSPGVDLLPSVEFEADPSMRPPRNIVTGVYTWPQWGWRYLGLEYEINWIYIPN